MKFSMSVFLRYLQNVCACSLGVAALALFAVPTAAAQQLRIAAASDLQFAMQDLAARYQTQTNQHVAISYGSSGNFFTQIENGAPFDLFFSADISYPQKLVADNLADPNTLYSYAFGRLVLWALPETHLGLAGKGLSALLDSQVHKIAIANPNHAPYGKAAIAALQKAGLYEKVKSKLVFGENISQTAQFVQSGNAQVGIVALSLATSPSMQEGDRWLIPAQLHPPLEQAAVIISSSKNKKSATAFMDFLRTPEARNILAGYGFSLTQISPAESKP